VIEALREKQKQLLQSAAYVILQPNHRKTAVEFDEVQERLRRMRPDADDMPSEKKRECVEAFVREVVVDFETGEFAIAIQEPAEQVEISASP
jgi:Na+-transporting NADH:ubiquinone oxidoreductase subunit NqrC